MAVCAGFNVETVEYKNISFTVWDVGGQDKVCTANRFYCVLIRQGLDEVRRTEVPRTPCTDPPSVEALLPEHPGPHLCGGQ